MLMEGPIESRWPFNFAREQARKTLRRPSRLLTVPVILVRLAIHRLLFLVDKVRWKLTLATVRLLNSINPQLAHYMFQNLGKELKRAEDEYFFRAGNVLFDDNKPDEAWKLFSRAINTSDDYSFFRAAGICLQHGLGRAREAIPLQVKSDALRFARARTLGFKRSRCFVLDRLWIAYFGHAAQVDYIVKLAALEGRDPNDTILYWPHDMQVANRFMAEQWAPHLRMVTRAEDLPFPEAALEFQALNFFVPDVGKGRAFYLWELAAQTYRRWHEQGRRPLLELPSDRAERGWDALESVGVPRDAWFVGLHVRSPGYQSHHRDLHYVLNAEIEDYLPAIREITGRGGWVVRMGDPSMPPLPALPNLFDYCHSDIRCDWLDVFLSASCRSFVGTSSGVCYAPQAYGVPCVLTNWWPPAQRPWHPGDIFIPKRLRQVRSGRFLTLEESLREPFGYCNSMEYLRKAHGVVVQQNDPEDIRAAVVEMLDRIDGTASYTESDLSARACAEKIYSSVARELYGSPSAFGAAMLARDFLRRDPSFVAIGMAKIDLTVEKRAVTR
jgi:putative glycosyltransferase (TIGR04372 family)